jgi:membrane-bound ClpP family serine protease
MTLGTIILLILIGMLLFVVEFLLVPGVTIAGIAGFILLVGAIYFGYNSLGTPDGHYILAGTVFISILTIYFSLRSRTWKKFMLDSRIEGKVSSYAEDKVKVGDEGKTITRLNPMGKVLINGEFLEAKSTGPYIEQNKKIKVVNIKDFRVTVDLLGEDETN